MAQGWKKYNATQPGVTNPAGTNTELTARPACVAKSHVVSLIGRPHLDLLHQEKLIPANIDLKLKLLPNTCAFLLKTAAPAQWDHPQVNYKVKIMVARLFIRTKNISPSLILGQDWVLQTKKYSIPFNNVVTITLPIPTGTSHIAFVNVYQGKLPDVVILAMVSDTSMSGGYQTNPFHFQNFGANYLCIHSNGEQIHRLISQTLPIKTI